MTTRFAAVSQPMARGMIYIHSSPASLCPHLEWAISNELAKTIDLVWTKQAADPGSKRAEFSWSAKAGTGAALASRLADFERVRFEVTEEAAPGSDGQRYCYTPTLGSFSAIIGVHGDILVAEDQLRNALAGDALMGEGLHHAVERLLGTAWDEELEIFRQAGEDAPVRWLHQVV